MQLADFDYRLPAERIAQQPLVDRAGARMLVLRRDERRWEDRRFAEFPQFLGPGDCLVLNDSRVIAARLLGRRLVRGKLMRGRVEILLLRPVSADAREWSCLVHPGRKMRRGEIIQVGAAARAAPGAAAIAGNQAPEPGGSGEVLEAEITGRADHGERTVRFHGSGDIYEQVERFGQVPLPPYIRRPPELQDRERYQTVFARAAGSVAAPTAGLHFTPAILEACRAAGAEIAHVTLHVGLGTFQPIHEDAIERHRLHSERFEITAENAARMRAARRLVAVGTTSVRVIEQQPRLLVPPGPGGAPEKQPPLGLLNVPSSSRGEALAAGGLEAARGETSLFIYPGFQFQGTGAMLTNFHLPRSSLLLLVSAFAGRELVLEAYRHAVESGYRFYSYGDCMLIL